MSKSRGFTLVELLVTITIIGILAAIGLVVYASFLQQGRNSKRQSDLRSIQSALEQYFADQFSYPPSVTSNSQLAAAGKTYMNSVPADPLGSPQPQYSYTLTPSGYCLYAELENPSIPSQLNGCAPSSGYNFAVTPP